MVSVVNGKTLVASHSNAQALVEDSLLLKALEHEPVSKMQTRLMSSRSSRDVATSFKIRSAVIPCVHTDKPNAQPKRCRPTMLLTLHGHEAV
jgi:hypothetical protein